MTRKTADRIIYVFGYYLLIGASLMSGNLLADYFMYFHYSMLSYLIILIVAFGWPWLALEWPSVFIADFLGICVMGPFFIDDIQELGGWMLYAKIGWVVANIILVIVVANIASIAPEEVEAEEPEEDYFYSNNTRGLQMSFRDEDEDDEDESFWTASSGSWSSNKGSSKSKGSWFSGGNSRSDYEKGREDGWRDSYLYGDSHKFDTGRTGGSKSYNDGYYDGYLDGDD